MLALLGWMPHAVSYRENTIAMPALEAQARYSMNRAGCVTHRLGSRGLGGRLWPSHDGAAGSLEVNQR